MNEKEKILHENILKHALQKNSKKRNLGKDEKNYLKRLEAKKILWNQFKSTVPPVFEKIDKTNRHLVVSRLKSKLMNLISCIKKRKAFSNAWSTITSNQCKGKALAALLLVIDPVNLIELTSHSNISYYYKVSEKIQNIIIEKIRKSISQKKSHINFYFKNSSFDFCISSKDKTIAVPFLEYYNQLILKNFLVADIADLITRFFCAFTNC